MRERERQFWNSYYNERPRPIDVLVGKEIRPSDVVEFVQICRGIFNTVRAINPDVIFIPERGAGPISWALETYEDMEDTHFFKAYLPIGTKINLDEGDITGSTKPEKYELISAWVDRTMEAKPGITKPLILDEVQSGSTLRTASQILMRVLREKLGLELLSVVGVEDALVDRPRAHGYGSIIEGKRIDMAGFHYKAPLFHVDRQPLLNHIVRYQDTTGDEISEATDRLPGQLDVVFNVEAINLYRNLVYAVNYPALFKVALDRIQKGEDRPVGDVGEQLYTWTKEIVDSTDEEKNRVSKEQILVWFTLLSDLALRRNIRGESREEVAREEIK